MKRIIVVLIAALFASLSALGESGGVQVIVNTANPLTSIAAVSAYWQQQIFAGKDLPPLTKASDAEVVAYVKANPNAIGYVSAASVTHEVKVLALK